MKHRPKLNRCITYSSPLNKTVPKIEKQRIKQKNILLCWRLSCELQLEIDFHQKVFLCN